MTTQVSHQLLDIPTLEIVNRRSAAPYAVYPGSWSNIELNTILLDEIGGVSITGGFQITGLPAGKYVVSGQQAHYAAHYVQLRVYDATNSNVLARGIQSYSVASDGPLATLGPNKITVPNGADLALQVLATNGISDSLLGVNVAHGSADYASIRFERVS